jgi:hypothetical protein
MTLGFSPAHSSIDLLSNELKTCRSKEDPQAILLEGGRFDERIWARAGSSTGSSRSGQAVLRPRPSERRQLHPGRPLLPCRHQIAGSRKHPRPVRRAPRLLGHGHALVANCTAARIGRRQDREQSHPARSDDSPGLEISRISESHGGAGAFFSDSVEQTQSSESLTTKVWHMI